MPRPSKFMRSCRLHDVQDPQSDRPIKTTSTSEEIFWRFSGVATLALVGLPQRTVLMPFSVKRFSTWSRNSGVRALPISNRPTVRPASDFGGARRARLTGEVSAVGSRIQLMVVSLESCLRTLHPIWDMGYGLCVSPQCGVEHPYPMAHIP